jgi:hypothetical protein
MKLVTDNNCRQAYNVLYWKNSEIISDYLRYLEHIPVKIIKMNILLVV